MSKAGPFNCCLICGSNSLHDVVTNRNFGINILQSDACYFVQSEYVSDRALASYYRNFYRGPLDTEDHRRTGKRASRRRKRKSPICSSSNPAQDFGGARLRQAEGSLGHELRAVADKSGSPRRTRSLSRCGGDRCSPWSSTPSWRRAVRRLSSIWSASLTCSSTSPIPAEAMDVSASVLKPGGLLLFDIPKELRVLQHGFQANVHSSYFTKEASRSSWTCRAASIWSRFAPATARSTSSSAADSPRPSNTTLRSPRTAPPSGRCCETGRRRPGSGGAPTRSTTPPCSTNTARACSTSTSCSKPPREGRGTREGAAHAAASPAARGDHQRAVQHAKRQRAQRAARRRDHAAGRLPGARGSLPSCSAATRPSCTPRSQKPSAGSPKTSSMSVAPRLQRSAWRAHCRNRGFSPTTPRSGAGHMRSRPAANHVGARAEVGGTCTFETLRDTIPRDDSTLLFVDCEGGELALLDPEQVPGIQGCDVIVECHDFLNPSITPTCGAVCQHP